MNQAIEIREYSYRYPDGTLALDTINLSIEKGQKVSLVGPNGSGKTTLLLAIAGFIRGSGTIKIDGMELSSRTLKRIRSRLGCCHENPDDQLFMPTLYEDVILGPLSMNLPHQQVRDNVEYAFETVGLTALADCPPQHLSIGHKRAAAIAAVLSVTPQIITFDQPDGSLDLRNRRKLEEVIDNLSQTLIVATCDTRFAAAVSDRAIVIDQGRIIADGPTQSILNDRDLMESHGLETP